MRMTIAPTATAATTLLTNVISQPRSVRMRSINGYTTNRPAPPNRLQMAIGPGSNEIHMYGAEKYQGGDTSEATSCGLAGRPSTGGKIMTTSTINTSRAIEMAPIFNVCS